MGIIDYTDYFHDGGIDSIKHENNTVELDIGSTEILPEWNLTKFSLTEDRTIKGKLILTDVKNILVDNVLVSDINRSGDGGILDLIIDGNKLDLNIIWFIPGGNTHTYEYIKFEFEDMTWIEHDKETAN